jgi:hypothetical protein
MYHSASTIYATARPLSKPWILWKNVFIVNCAITFLFATFVRITFRPDKHFATCTSGTAEKCADATVDLCICLIVTRLGMYRPFSVKLPSVEFQALFRVPRIVTGVNFFSSRYARILGTNWCEPAELPEGNSRTSADALCVPTLRLEPSTSVPALVTCVLWTWRSQQCFCSTVFRVHWVTLSMLKI